MTHVYVGPIATAPTVDIVLDPDATLFSGVEDFKSYFGAATSLENDLLLLGSSVFAADRAVRRGEREDFARHSELSIPVMNVGRLAPYANTVERVLRFLSRDDWRLTLRQISGGPEQTSIPEDRGGVSLLLSGGLDSLAAAIELGQNSVPAQLISHITRNTVARNAQRNIVAALAAAGFAMPHYQFFVSSQNGPGNPAHDDENSQRTRSFLFLILACLAARRTGHRRVVWLAENGHMAIHLPLVPARVGAFSTHTANPRFISMMQSLITAVLGIPIQIDNPYLYRTKREIVEAIRVTVPSTIPLSVSCWRSPRSGTVAAHCGICIPCFIRRVALEHSGADPTRYANDPWMASLSDQGAEEVGRRNLVDLGVFVQRVERSNDSEVMHQWPELFGTSINAPLAIDMYRRFCAEVRAVLSRYPLIAAVLQ